MGRIALMLVLLPLSGCTAASAVSGFAADRVVHLFESEEETLPVSMRASLVAVQKSLGGVYLDVALLEPIEDGYLMEFGNGRLDGRIKLRRQTPLLTTVSVQVKSGMKREDSVERAILEGIRKHVQHVTVADRFQFGRYDNILEQPSADAARLGWYLPGSRLEVRTTERAEWLKIKLPSGRTAYLKGQLAE